MERKFNITIRDRKLPKELSNYVETIFDVGRNSLYSVIEELGINLSPAEETLLEGQLSQSERLYAGALRLSQLLSKEAVQGNRFNPKRSIWFNPDGKNWIIRARGVFTPQTLVWQLDGIPLLRQRGGLKEIVSVNNQGVRGQFSGIIHDVLGSATSLNLGAEFPAVSAVAFVLSSSGKGDNFCLPYHPGIHQIIAAEYFADLYPNSEEIYFFSESSGTAVNSTAIEAVCAYGEKVFPGKFPKVLQVDGTWCGGFGTAKEGTGFGVAEQAEKRGGLRWVDRCLPLPTAEYRELFLQIVREKIAKGEAAGVFLEPIVGDAGIVPADPQLVKELIEILKEGANGYSLPIIVDTVQQGTGRTGFYWGIEHLPELSNYPLLVLTTAKSTSNGQPFGMMLIPKLIAEKAYPLSMITTNSGNGGLIRAMLVAEFVTQPEIQIIIDQNATIIDEVAQQFGLNLRGLRMNRGIDVGSKELMELIQWHLLIKYGILVGALPGVIRFQPMLLEHPETIRNITTATCQGILEVLNNVKLNPDGTAKTLNPNIVPEEVINSFNSSKNPSGLNR
jgi:acetylornithine/succinyldiaminopimelate/putrescine aminotransferase